MTDFPDPAASRDLIAKVNAYYSAKSVAFGATPKGVDWKDDHAQQERFAQIYKIIGNSPRKDGGDSVLDLGCGYAAFLPFLRQHGFTGSYTGIDVSAEQIAQGERYLAAQTGMHPYRLMQAEQPDVSADYAVASGIFSVKLDIDAAEWQDYIFSQCDVMHAFSRKGFAFNCPTVHVDWRRDDLFYGDPAVFLNECQCRYGPQVALLQDYGLYEFTLLIRKDMP